MSDLLLIDGNALGFAAHSTNKLHSGGQETQAIFGFLRSLRGLLDEFRGSTPIVFWDGESFRKHVCAEYKAQRDEDPKMKAERDAYKTQRPHIARALHTLGVRQKVASNLEADDLIAMTVWKLNGKTPATIITGDRDLLQLVGPNVRWHNPIQYRNGTPKFRHMTEHEFAEATEFETTDAFVQGKALMGDNSDNLKGVGGLGEKAAPLILGHWGSVPNAIKDLRANGEAAIPDFLRRYRKKLLDFANDEERIQLFARNMKMMHLTPKNLPAPVGNKTVSGAFDREKFEGVCDEFGFISILRDFDGWIRPFELANPSYAPKKLAA